MFAFAVRAAPACRHSLPAAQLAAETMGRSPRFLLHYLKILRLPVSVAAGPSTLDWLVGWLFLKVQKTGRSWSLPGCLW